jgi:isocitrate dehydrogenase (NAD+)
MAHQVTLIPGDGVGPEVTLAAQRAVEATGVKIKWEVQRAGAEVMAQEGTPLPDQVLESIKRNKVALKGPITTPIGVGFRSVNVALRKALDLYVNLRPARTIPGVPSRYEDVDLIIVRENTEDLYVGRERQVIPGEAAEAIKVITRQGSQRIVRFAFEYARSNGRKKVTAVHKANVLKLTDGLFLHVAREVARGYPDIGFEDLIVDNMCMQLVLNPDLYDILVMPNLYGDIVSDLAAGLVGGLGVMPGANLGQEVAVFEPAHGSVPQFAGQNKANPAAMILSAALMLRHLGEAEAAQRVEKAVAATIAEGRHVTGDLKPRNRQSEAVGTAEMTDAIIGHLGKGDVLGTTY